MKILFVCTGNTCRLEILRLTARVYFADLESR